MFGEQTFAQLRTSLTPPPPHTHTHAHTQACKHAVLQLAMKKDAVLPDSMVPYWMSVCLARSSAESMGVSIRSTVRKAARLAV